MEKRKSKWQSCNFVHVNIGEHVYKITFLKILKKIYISFFVSEALHDSKKRKEKKGLLCFRGWLD